MIPEKAKKAIEMITVVVGSAITRPQLITKKFNEEVIKALYCMNILEVEICFYLYFAKKKLHYFTWISAKIRYIVNTYLK